MYINLATGNPNWKNCTSPSMDVSFPEYFRRISRIFPYHGNISILWNQTKLSKLTFYSTRNHYFNRFSPRRLFSFRFVLQNRTSRFSNLFLQYFYTMEEVRFLQLTMLFNHKRSVQKLVLIIPRGLLSNSKTALSPPGLP